MIAPAGTAQSDLRDALWLHLGKLPENAPLRRVIASDPIQKLVDLFDKADATAIEEQRTYRRFGHLALWATMAGTIVGALVLLPIDQWTTGWPRLVIQGMQAVALALSFVATLWMGWRQSVGRWLRARALAEVLRGDVFHAIIQTATEARGLLVPALACFKDAHLNWQLAYYRRRGLQHRLSAGNTAPYKLLGYLVLAVAVFIGLIGFVNLAATFEWGWLPIKTLAQWFPFEDPGRWQLGLGVMATSILAFANARPFIDQDDRLAVLCELAAERLEEIEREGMAEADAAAASGDADAVVAFCRGVQGIMSAEHLAWAYPRPFDDVRTASGRGMAPAE
jgi:SMODS and SLOG-associating 2TM effector domain 3